MVTVTVIPFDLELPVTVGVAEYMTEDANLYKYHADVKASGKVALLTALAKRDTIVKEQRK